MKLTDKDPYCKQCGYAPVPDTDYCEKHTDPRMRLGFHLPGQGHTDDVRAYSAAWKPLIAKAEAFFPSYRVSGFDPDLQMVKKDIKNTLIRNTFTLSVDAVLDLKAPEGK